MKSGSLHRISNGLRSASLYGMLAAGCLGAQAGDIPSDFDLKPRPMLEDSVNRALRYYPEGTDFVITNGSEFFNRPLYGGNSAFRIDAGDLPEFALYVSGRAGNLRLGVKNGSQSKWLHQVTQIISRYRAGAMIYEIQDPLLNGGTIHLSVLATRQSEGLLLRCELRDAKAPVEFFCAFGGVNGERGRRDGDIGCESKPVSEFFQLRPEQCRSNVVVTGTNSFVLRGKGGVIHGLLPEHSTLAISDAEKWTNLKELIDATRDRQDRPIVLGQFTLFPNQPVFLGIKRDASDNLPNETLPVYREVAEPAAEKGKASAPQSEWNVSDLPKLFADEEQKRRAIAERVRVETPDAFINAAAAALNIAADAVWDERQKSFMHGAVAWRVRLLGWRGAYSGDALGWHDRTQQHLEGYAKQQNTSPVPGEMPSSDLSANLSRNESALHSNGDLTRSHYDMNLVSIDAFFRHLLWTGDLDFAREMWPTLERHLAWERRLFRREFGPEKLPLYEGYCCIWASDDLAYNGGGATHSSAYNFYHNQMAARVARMIGKDPAPYEQEAASIARAMRQELWLPDRGWFAEWKDLLGQQSVHPNAAAWTFYHAIDSEVPTTLEAWQMSRFADTTLSRIPVRGPGVPAGNFTISTTSWMPYTWSLNNVVLAESAHTALAYWQADRSDAAFPLLKGALLDSMYLGLCPGNVGMCTYYDAYRRESQRDFADGVGSLSRALIEGLFGLKPDLMKGELRLRPGFPPSWDHARLAHPDFEFSFRRNGNDETYRFVSKFPRTPALHLQAAALKDRVASVTVNNQSVAWHVIDDSVGGPRIEIDCPPTPEQTIVISWSGKSPQSATNAPIAASSNPFQAECGSAILQVSDPQHALSDIRSHDDVIEGSVRGLAGHRTLFAKVQQGDLRWWQPVSFEIRPAWEILPLENQAAGQIRFRIRNNTAQRVNRSISIRIAGQNTSARLDVDAFTNSSELVVSTDNLLPGSNRIDAEVQPGITVTGEVANWKIAAPRNAAFEPIDLVAVFNDQVTQIFRHEYLSPRSPFCSLALPKQGIGSWCHPSDTFEVNDSGLRELSRKNGERIALPMGVFFKTPSQSDAKNILFVSQWQNFPDNTSVPLSGRARHVYFLMAGSSNPMQSQFDNGEVVVTYTDGATSRLALRNPTTWWPIDQDYFLDDFAFHRPEPIPPRVDLKTGTIRLMDANTFKGKGRTVPGGAATVLDLPLEASKELKSLTVRATANEVVIGLMSATLVRP